MARSLAVALDAATLTSTISRLLIDLNRPAGHPHLFSAVTRHESAAQRAKIRTRYHEPYWIRLRRFVRQSVASGQRTIHISSHSFTPVMDGQMRTADVGLLYDPGRPGEAELCARWKAALVEREPELRVRRNYPYRGKAAGLTARMRCCFAAGDYIGIELEVNQRFVSADARRWRALRALLAQSLRAACNAFALQERAPAKQGLRGSKPVSTNGPRTNLSDA